MTGQEVFDTDRPEMISVKIRINPYDINSMINEDELSKDTVRQTADRWASWNSLKLKAATGLVRAVGVIQEEGEGKPGEPWEVHRSRQAAGKGTFNMDSLIKAGGCTWKMREQTMIDKAMTMQVQVNTSISFSVMKIHPETTLCDILRKGLNHLR